jgi:hypothetical protein
LEKLGHSSRVERLHEAVGSNLSTTPKKKKVIGSGTGQDLRNEGKKWVTSNLIIDVGI